MATKYNIPLWKSAPFIRLLLPLIVGIVAQWYMQFPFYISSLLSIVCLLLFGLFYLLPIGIRYKYQWLQGLLLNCIIFFVGILLTWGKDIRTDKNWYGNFYSDSSSLVIKINEPPLAKQNSFKVEGMVEEVIKNGIHQKTNGKILLYFSKNETDTVPRYGDKILITGGLQQIKNAGNPGGFNYSRYMAFQQIIHQVYLKKENYYLLDGHSENPLYSFIFWARSATINSLQKYVQGNHTVTGIVEALLIGYKEDLDKDVVQAYSNTGVVHIIAISGMHLGLIYIGLIWLFSRMPFVKRSALTRVILIISCLWLFSLITGASASVLRSAVMFTCVIIGKEFFKQASIYNSLAASAFLLLSYNPFLLWDVGFQLSYLAIIGIVWLQKPIQDLLYSKYKVLQYLWQMCSISIAAQILTLPICIYYFHQIPTTFLFTNLICVPLSTLILFAEIGLLVCSFIPALAAVMGKFIYVLTWSMNAIIEFFNKLPLSLIDKIYATPLTTWVMYTFIFLLSASLLRRNKRLLKMALGSLLLFATTWSFGKIKLQGQKKIIVYNVSRHTALDFVSDNKYWFYGDEAFEADASLKNFHLKPARVSMQAEESKDSLQALTHKGKIWQFYNKKIMIVDTAVTFEPLNNKIKVDALLICKKPYIKISDITNAVTPTTIVFDASNSLWKIAQWKKECDELHLQYFITGEQGAFILDAN